MAKSRSRAAAIGGYHQRGDVRKPVHHTLTEQKAAGKLRQSGPGAQQRSQLLAIRGQNELVFAYDLYGLSCRIAAAHHANFESLARKSQSFRL